MRIFYHKNIKRRGAAALCALVLFLCFPSPASAQGNIFESLAAQAGEAVEESGGFFTRTFDFIGNTFTQITDFVGGVFSGDSESDSTGENEQVTEVAEETETAPPPLPPPTEPGTVTTVLESATPLSEALQGLSDAFIVNANLQAEGDFSVSGAANVNDLTASGTANLSSLIVPGAANLSLLTASNLTVTGAARTVGLLAAEGGITTRGADIDLEGGEIIGLEVVNSIEAGENVVITGGPGNLIISVPEADDHTSGGGNVDLVNGQSGVVTLTLADVRAAGGCAACILDADVADVLTITGGTIDGVVIGATAPAAGSFTTLTVTGSGAFTGTVSGADAVNTDEFVTLGQLNAATGGGGGGNIVSSLNGLDGDLFIAGTAGQISVASAGSTITLSLPQDIAATASPSFVDLALSGNLSVSGDATIAGLVTGGTFVSDPNDATVRKSGEEILRASVSIYPFPLPASTGSTTFTRISKQFMSTFDNPLAGEPAPIAGTTRVYKLVLKYADSVPTAGDTSWRIFKPSTGTVIDSFTISGQNKISLEEPEIVISNPVTIPTGDWQLEVSVPSGRIRVMDIHLVSFDVVN